MDRLGCPQDPDRSGRSERRIPRPNPRHADYTYPLPANSIELALGDDAYHVSYRGLLHPGGGYGQLEWLGDDDNNYVASARIMRFTARDAAFPLTIGVGIGAYASFRDRRDSDAQALSLIGSVYYDFSTSVPTNIGIDFSYAPDISVFDDGERLLDATFSYGLDVSPWASAFVGYRYFTVDYTDDTDFEFADQVMVGVRLFW